MASRKGNRKRQQKRQEEPEQPIQGDIGPLTDAQMYGAVIAEHEELNERGEIIQRAQRKFRDHRLTLMAKANGKRPAMITAREAAAGIELCDRHEATMTSPPLAWTRIYVDSSPRPGDVNVRMLEAKRKYADLSRHVRREEWPIVRAICFDGLSIRPGFTKDPGRAEKHLATLRGALGRLANVMGM